MGRTALAVAQEREGFWKLRETAPGQKRAKTEPLIGELRLFLHGFTHTELIAAMGPVPCVWSTVKGMQSPRLVGSAPPG